MSIEKGNEYLDYTKIYDLDLFDSLQISTNECIMRVPGGWIYKDYYDETKANICFIPLHNEFTRRY